MRPSSAPKKKDENVLVFETRLLHEIGHFQGLNANVEPYISAIFTPGTDTGDIIKFIREHVRKN